MRQVGYKYKMYERVTIVGMREEDRHGVITGILSNTATPAYQVQSKDCVYVVGEESLESRNSEVEFKTITLPILNELDTVTLESAILKVFEEGGELSQVIGKKRGLNGETDIISDNEALKQIGEELVDLFQTAVTMSKLLEDKYDIKVNDFIEHHIAKVIRKGYLS